MIPSSGSINVLSTTTLGTTALTGTLTGTTVVGSRLLIVTGTPPIALDGIRTTAGLFLGNVTNFPVGCRVVAQQSPVSYAYVGVSHATGTATLSVATMPFASVSGQTFIVTGARTPALNGTYVTNAVGSTATFVFALAADPLGGFSGCSVTPGIVNSVAGTGSGCVGYYTINMPATAAVSAASLSTATFTPFVLPAGTTHVIGTAVTATNTFAALILDGVGSVTLPCLDIVCFKNLFAGSYVMANGSAVTDVSKLVFCTVNPNGRT